MIGLKPHAMTPFATTLPPKLATLRALAFHSHVARLLKAQSDLLPQHRKLFRKPQIIPRHPPESLPAEETPEVK
jgi:hypothetical protein